MLVVWLSSEYDSVQLSSYIFIYLFIDFNLQFGLLRQIEIKHMQTHKHKLPISPTLARHLRWHANHVTHVSAPPTLARHHVTQASTPLTQAPHPRHPR